MASDEYRVEVDLDDEAHGHPFSERLAALDLNDEVAKRLGERVIVTRDGPKLFVYTETRGACTEAELVVREALTEDGLFAEVSSTRWNPVTRAWQDADAPFEAPEGSLPHDERRWRRRACLRPCSSMLKDTSRVSCATSASDRRRILDKRLHLDNGGSRWEDGFSIQSRRHDDQGRSLRMRYRRQSRD